MDVTALLGGLLEYVSLLLQLVRTGVIVDVSILDAA